MDRFDMYGDELVPDTQGEGVRYVDVKAALAAAAPSPAGEHHPHVFDAVRPLRSVATGGTNTGSPSASKTAASFVGHIPRPEFSDKAFTHGIPIASETAPEPKRYESVGQMLDAWGHPDTRNTSAAASETAETASVAAKLKDPVAVHVAMLRGEIAKPAIRDLLHAYGADALAQYDRGANDAAASVAGLTQYADSTPHLHVGDSAFEDWYQGYCLSIPANPKQAARDAYAAGMGDPLVVARAAQGEVPAEPSAELIEAAFEKLMKAAWTWGESCGVDDVRWGKKGDSHNEWMRDNAYAAERELRKLLTPPARDAGLSDEQRQQGVEAQMYRWLRSNRDQRDPATGHMLDVFDEDGSLLYDENLDDAIRNCILAAATKEPT